jgi:PleD family two-component response regulator
MLEKYPDIGRFSAGIVEINRDGLIENFAATYGKAIDEADSLHYRAKHTGRNRIAMAANNKVSFKKTLK